MYKTDDHNWQIRIRKCLSADTIPKTFYVIDQIISADRLYITWQGNHSTIQSAVQKIKTELTHIPENQILIKEVNK